MAAAREEVLQLCCRDKYSAYIAQHLRFGKRCCTCSSGPYGTSVVERNQMGFSNVTGKYRPKRGGCETATQRKKRRYRTGDQETAQDIRVVKKQKSERAAGLTVDILALEYKQHSRDDIDTAEWQRRPVLELVEEEVSARNKLGRVPQPVRARLLHWQ